MDFSFLEFLTPVDAPNCNKPKYWFADENTAHSQLSPKACLRSRAQSPTFPGVYTITRLRMPQPDSGGPYSMRFVTRRSIPPKNKIANVHQAQQVPISLIGRRPPGRSLSLGSVHLFRLKHRIIRDHHNIPTTTLSVQPKRGSQPPLS